MSKNLIGSILYIILGIAIDREPSVIAPEKVVDRLPNVPSQRLPAVFMSHQQLSIIRCTGVFMLLQTQH
jgi:hypothetical protein